MGDDFKKQTSTIAARQALGFLLGKDFQIARVDEIKPTKKAYHKDVLNARREFGNDAAISITGRSVTLEGVHATTGHQVQVDVPLFEMLGHGARTAIEKKTGLTFTQ